VRTGGEAVAPATTVVQSGPQTAGSHAGARMMPGPLAAPTGRLRVQLLQMLLLLTGLLLTGPLQTGPLLTGLLAAPTGRLSGGRRVTGPRAMAAPTGPLSPAVAAGGRVQLVQCW
jgi:hypothetical protein